MSKWSEPSPSDWDRWEQRLLNGEEPSTAAKAEHQTCSAFKRQDPVRHGEALAMSRETRAHYADERMEAWVTPDEASDAIKLGWARRWQPAYGTNARVEVTGADGGPVEIEDRSASLADVARVLEAVGALAELSGGAARDTLPTP